VLDRPEVPAFLAAHHWVASIEQLGALKVTTSALEHGRRWGELRSPVPGVVVLPGVELSIEGRALLAQLAGHRIVEQRDVGVRHDGLRVASPLRMLFGLAGQFNQFRFERAAEDVWHRGLVPPESAWEYLELIRRAGRGGVQRMAEWLEKAALRDRPAQSGLELDPVAIVERAGLPEPVRQQPLQLPSGEVIHLDLAWPAIRLAVEPGHSWWHGGDLGQRRDQAPDRACSAVGWQVDRYDEQAARRPAAIAVELGAVYRAR
jgi:hypothetical protein